MKLMFKIVGSILIAFVLMLGGCAVLIGGAVNEVDKSVQKTTSSNAKHAMSEKTFKQVKTDRATPYERFVKRHGEPDPEMTQEQHVDGTELLTIYYHIEGGGLMDMYQFSFTDGKLDGKGKY